MNSRWYNVAVCALWLSTMSWLVIAKILPSLVVGDPPDPVAALAAQAEEQLVGYEVHWEQEPIGWALIRADRRTNGTTLVDGRLRFNQLPIRHLVPELLLKLFGWEGSMPEQLHLDAKSTVLFHATGRLQRFDSTVSLDPGFSTIRVEGFVAGENIILSIRSAGTTYEASRPLPHNAMVSDGLMPQSRMPGLLKGRRWTVEVYSPLRPRTDPMEIMQAEVVGRDPISWAGEIETPWLVVYRSDPGSEVGRAGKEQAWLWVRDDGAVLQHRIALLDSTLTFVRMPEEKGRELEQSVGEQAGIPGREPGDGPYGAPGQVVEKNSQATEMETEVQQP